MKTGAKIIFLINIPNIIFFAVKRQIGSDLFKLKILLQKLNV
jgi:hypothetical protein